LISQWQQTTHLKAFRDSFSLPEAVVEVDVNERRQLDARNAVTNVRSWVIRASAVS